MQNGDPLFVLRKLCFFSDEIPPTGDPKRDYIIELGRRYLSKGRILRATNFTNIIDHFISAIESSESDLSDKNRLLLFGGIGSLCASLVEYHGDFIKRHPGIPWCELAELPLVLNIAVHDHIQVAGASFPTKRYVDPELENLILKTNLQDISKVLTFIRKYGFYRQIKPIGLQIKQFMDFHRDEAHLQAIYYCARTLLMADNFMVHLDERLINGEFSLMQAVAIGEAFSNLSDVIEGQFDLDIRRSFIDIRTMLCHTERRNRLSELHELFLRKSEFHLAKLFSFSKEKYHLVLKSIKNQARTILTKRYGYVFSESVVGGPCSLDPLPAVGKYKLINMARPSETEPPEQSQPIPGIQHFNRKWQQQIETYYNSRHHVTVSIHVQHRDPNEILSIEPLAHHWFVQCIKQCNEMSLNELCTFLFENRDKFFATSQCVSSKELSRDDLQFISDFQQVRDTFWARLKRNGNIQELLNYLLMFEGDRTAEPSALINRWYEKYDDFLRQVISRCSHPKTLEEIDQCLHFFSSRRWRYRFLRKGEPEHSLQNKILHIGNQKERGLIKPMRGEKFSETKENPTEIEMLSLAQFQLRILKGIHERACNVKSIIDGKERSAIEFLEQKDHHMAAVLADLAMLSGAIKSYYQLLAGNLARGLLDNQHFIKIASDDLLKILNEIFRHERGLDAHNQQRRLGCRAPSMFKKNPFQEEAIVPIGIVIRNNGNGTIDLFQNPFAMWPAVHFFGGRIHHIDTMLGRLSVQIEELRGDKDILRVLDTSSSSVDDDQNPPINAAGNCLNLT